MTPRTDIKKSKPPIQPDGEVDRPQNVKVSGQKKPQATDLKKYRDPNDAA
jgi:hypothetical protein